MAIFFKHRGIFKWRKQLWLPLGWNPDTLNLQIDDLLMQAGGFKNPGQLRVYLNEWYLKSGLKKYDNDLTLKLTWLRELVDVNKKNLDNELKAMQDEYEADMDEIE